MAKINIKFNGVTYSIDESVLADARATFETALSVMTQGSSAAPGLYQTGAIALYKEQGVEAIKGMMITSWDDLVASGEVIVNEGIVSKSDDASFAGDLFISGDVTSISDNAFVMYGGLTGVAFCEDSQLTSIGLNAFNRCAQLINIIIPSGVTTIPGCCFELCSGLVSVGCLGSGTSVEIPNSVTNIDEAAFKNCSSLTSVILPKGVTTIGYEAFRVCRSLTSITIPDTVVSIDENVFKVCSVLKDIVFEGTMEQWKAIDKGNDWNASVPATHVHCTDGDVAL